MIKRTLLQDKYPIYTLELHKNEANYNSVDDILTHFKTMIEGNPAIKFIGIFDHYAHTAQIPDSFINPDIRDAKIILFCFGNEIRDTGFLAVRPRSIGVAELEKSFIITFLEAPSPKANSTMVTWTMALKTS